jgi:hypothetical protein
VTSDAEISFVLRGGKNYLPPGYLKQDGKYYVHTKNLVGNQFRSGAIISGTSGLQ